MRATTKNPDLIMNIRKSNNPVNMGTNTSSKIMDLDSNIPKLGVGKFDSKQMANILGFSHMTNMHQITYDSVKEDTFLVHTPDGIVKFKREGRVYTYKPGDRYLKHVADLKRTKLPTSDNDSDYSDTNNRTDNEDNPVTSSNLQECTDDFFVQECANNCNLQECEEHEEYKECEDELNNIINSVLEN